MKQFYKSPLVLTSEISFLSKLVITNCIFLSIVSPATFIFNFRLNFMALFGNNRSQNVLHIL